MDRPPLHPTSPFNSGHVVKLKSSKIQREVKAVLCTLRCSQRVTINYNDNLCVGLFVYGQRS
ncbi:UNVERIFIED_CONTAM: hypothetical protein FKN15_073447 [Acipenser sinensis]